MTLQCFLRVLKQFVGHAFQPSPLFMFSEFKKKPLKMTTILPSFSSTGGGGEARFLLSCEALMIRNDKTPSHNVLSKIKS